MRYGEPLEDLTPLTGLTGLTRLCTEFQGIRDLTPLSGLRRLEVVDLNITTIPVDDTTPLTVLPALRLARARGLDCGLLPQVATCESRVYPY